MCQITFFLVCFIFALSVKNVKGVTSSAIPSLLHHCYANKPNPTLKHPHTLQAFLEIIRKLETHSGNFVNARILSTSILHSIIFDGIRQTSDFESAAIPFRATGDEFYKYRLLVDYLTSGESLLFPSEALTPSELCFLHTLISNSVDLQRRKDESTTCTHQTNLPLEIDSLEDTGEISRCPLKKGVINTQWGSVSGGHLIKAIASALQKTRVTVERVEEAINAHKHRSVTINGNHVNNIWVATIAGDLAAVVLKQISVRPEISTGGFWNDTLLPRLYYLENGYWDMTESDILGGIDGLAIARYLEDNDVANIRVSQLIDMFYSERGIMNNAEYKVTNRSLILRKLLQENPLEIQTAVAARLLQQVGTYDSFLYPEQIDRLAAAAAQTFTAVADNITKIYDNVESVHRIQMRSSMEVIMIFDGSYDAYKALQIIHGVSQAIQVSRYGSSLGVINGQSGNWMANVTREQFQLFSDLEQSTTSWPSALSLRNSLDSAIRYYEYSIETNCSNRKPMARSIVIVTKDAQLTDPDVEASLRAFNAIKKSNPETSFIVSSTTETGLVKFTRNFWGNDYVLTSGNTHSVVQDIISVISRVPGNIPSFSCGQGQMEDYITPNRETLYQIREEYIAEHPIVTKFCKSNQGELSVCARSVTKSTEICRNLTVNDEISFGSTELCTPAFACNVEFRILASGSQDLCTEDECRYPDQVRLTIIWQRSSGYVPVFEHVHLILSTVFLILINYS